MRDLGNAHTLGQYTLLWSINGKMIEKQHVSLRDQTKRKDNIRI